MSLIKEPTQQRSLATQERILDAFEALLNDFFLDDITVRQIATKADITPATIYRRFENKDALLPILYERYEKRLEIWATKIWSQDTLVQYKTMIERIRHIVHSHVDFFSNNKSMIRTLYLKARTSNIDLELTGNADRKQTYTKILTPVLELCPQESIANLGTKVPFFILILISSMNEKLVFDDQKPAKLLDINDEEFATQLSQCLNDILLRP